MSYRDKMLLNFDEAHNAVESCLSVRVESAEGVLELSADELVGLKKDHENLIKPKNINELFNHVTDAEQQSFAADLVQKTHDQTSQLDAAVFLGHFADEINETISDKTNFEQSPETLDGLIEHLTSAELPVDRTMLVKLAIVFQSNVLLHHDRTDALTSTFASEPVAGRFSMSNIPEGEQTDTQSDILKSLVSAAFNLDEGAPRLRALSVNMLEKGGSEVRDHAGALRPSCSHCRTRRAQRRGHFGYCQQAAASVAPFQHRL